MPLNKEMDNHALLILEREYHFFHIKNDLETYPKDMIRRMEEKIIEIVESEPFKFKTVILKLILAHEYADVENYKTALDTLEELESDIEQLEETDCNDFLFKDVSTALFNVMRTCKAHVLISKNDEKKARKIIKKIIALEDLDTANKASVYGIRSMVFMEYGLYGHKMAFENAEKARKIDPKNPYWHFLIGKSLGRIRRVEKPFDIPSDEERNALKIAIEMNDNYLFMLYTAESYVETSSRTFRFHNRNRSLYPSLKVSIDQMNEEASNLYKKCILKEPNCSHVLFRAARGFLNLPHPQRDPERAKELLLKGLESNPRNPFANHLLAKYYERFDHNIPKAIKHLQICTEQQVFGAEMDLLRLQFSKDGVAAKAVEKLENLLDVYTEAPRKIQLLTQMASYYIFIDPNLPEACKLLKQAMTTNCDDNILFHRSIFLRVRQPFSILDVLVDELKLQMEKDCTQENKKLYESFIFDLNDSNVSILKGRAKNLKYEIMKEDEETRLGNYYKRERPTNPNMRRHSFQKPIPKSAHQQKIEKAHSVEQVDNFFDSWIDDDKKTENKSNGFSKTNYSKSSGSCSDASPASDSRFSRSSGRPKRNRYEYSRNDTDQDAQFDRLSYASTLRDGSRSTQYQNKPTKNDNIADDFDRLSISSNRSGFSNVSRGSRGRGRSSYSNSRPSQDRGDFDRNSLGRGSGRQFNSNDSRSNFNNSNASKFPRGRGHAPRPPVERSNFDRTNTYDSRRNEPNSGNSPSRESRFKTTDYSKSNTSFDRKNNTSTSVRGEQNSENGSFKNWPQRSNRSPDETEERANSRNKEHTKAKPPSKSFHVQDSDSDDDLMSYFTKK